MSDGTLVAVIRPGLTNVNRVLPFAEVKLPQTHEPDADGIYFTGLETDLAIRGSGWFVLKDPSSGQIYYTREGNFRLDANGYLITASGYRVQGGLGPDPSGPTDVIIDSTYDFAHSGAIATSFVIQTNGQILVSLSDGTAFVRGQIYLQNFGAPENLIRNEGAVFAATLTALPASGMLPPGTAAAGWLVPQSLQRLVFRPHLTALEREHGSPF